ncbi:MAG: hypothetical protein AB7Q17_10125 [Phycisphaerae bacterium]
MIRPRTISIWVGLLALTLAGCRGAVVGKWSLERARPNREVFAIDAAEFRSDGSYQATTTIEGRTQHEHGAFRFNGFTLTLRPEGGGQRAYEATVGPRRMELRAKDKQHVVLRRER